MFDPKEARWFSVLGWALCGVLSVRGRLLSGKDWQAQRMFSDMVEHVSDYAIYRISPEGIIQTWNQGAERIKGYTDEEIIGQHFGIFYTEAERAAGWPQQTLERARTQSVSVEGWRVRKDGSQFWASVAINPILNARGKLLGFTKVTRDLTERVEANERLAQAQKLESLGQLTGGVAHDFNNLLTVVMGALELAKSLMDRTEVADPIRKRMTRYLGTIGDACGRGAALTHQLLAFARRQPLQPTVVDPVAILRESTAMMTKTIRQDIRVLLTIPAAGLPLIKVDPSQLSRGLLNVVLNARDAMAEGGQLHIIAEQITLHGRDRPPGTGKLSGDFLAIYVQDTGCGIAEENQDKVLEPFFTTKGVGKGSGLGLSQAHGFCTQSGGTLTIQSSVGQGTQVTFYLPVTTEPLAILTPEPEQVEIQPSDRSSRILLVEDDMDVAEVTTGTLENAGYRVVRVASAQTALSQLSCGYRVDLLFVDMVLPGGASGLELAEQVRARFPWVPVLLTSGYADMVDRGPSVPFTVVPKPYRPGELLAAIAAAMPQVGEYAESEVG